MKDFNICCCSNEKLSGCPPPRRACYDSRNAIDDCNLVALDKVRALYSWCNEHRGNNCIDISLAISFYNSNAMSFWDSIVC